MVGDPHDAQDALQNTMVKVLRALPGEQRNIHLKPWLYRIARNESVETIRKRREGTTTTPDETPAPWEFAETVETRDRLRRLMHDLGELPERQRAALVLRELSGLGFEQIGNALGSSPKAARQMLYEARLSLRTMEAGHEMSCDAVTRELSDADGRVARRRDLRAHLRSCASCREFRAGIAARQTTLAAIAPLPAVVSAALLNGALGGASAGAVGAGAGAGAGASGGLAGAIGVGVGNATATVAVVKSAATVAVVAAVGVTAADRGGLIDVPIRGKAEGATSALAAPPARPSAPPEGRRARPLGSNVAARGDKTATDRRSDGNRVEIGVHEVGAGATQYPVEVNGSTGYKTAGGHTPPAITRSEIPTVASDGQKAAADKAPHPSIAPDQPLPDPKTKAPPMPLQETEPLEITVPAVTETPEEGGETAPEETPPSSPPGQPEEGGPPAEAGGNKGGEPMLSGNYPVS